VRMDETGEPKHQRYTEDIMSMRKGFHRAFMILLVLALPAAASAGGTSRTEHFTVPASGVREVAFKNIAFADLTYRGTGNAGEFTVRFERIVKKAHGEELDEIMDEIKLDADRSGGKVTFNLIHPGTARRGVFKRMFGRKDWEVKIEVTGPGDIDIGIDAEFSKVGTSSTSGTVRVECGFSEVSVRNHTGRLDADLRFSRLDCDGLDGSFGVEAGFGDTNISVVRLGGDSAADISFGNFDLRLPEGAGAELRVDKSFGSARFRTRGTVREDGGCSILGCGGPRIDVNVEFGELNVRDDAEPRRTSAARGRCGKTSPPPEPRFEEGAVKSIRVTGTRLLKDDDVLGMLAVEEGKTYTRGEIEKAVKELREKSRFIEHAGYDIDREGNLTVRIHEAALHKRSLDMDVSFSRVGGVGIGPKLRVTSLVGPVSGISGEARYNFAAEEWTYRAGVEKGFFDGNRLVFGGTYRLAYESAMDWAVPPIESYMNAFLGGLETKHYHRVEGATGYIGLSSREGVRIRGEYFEEKFGSLEKHTDWSLFNRRHVKDANLPLSPVDEGRLVGVRLRGEFSHRFMFSSARLVLEAERALDRGDGYLGPYTRLFGNGVATWKLSPENYLKVRLAGGYSRDVLPAPRAFNLGGHNTLRGFDYQSIPGGYPFSFQYGGNRMVLCNVEYLLGKEDDIGMVLFADAGGVWMKKQDLRLGDIKRDVGVSLTFDFEVFGLDTGSGAGERPEGLRVNWAVPVGDEPHVSHWTLNFVQTF